MSTLSRTEYTALPAGERESLLCRLAASHRGFTFEGMTRFAAFGRQTDTAVLRYEDGSAFVFVPGDTVTLGWDGSASAMDEKTCRDLSENLAEYGESDVDNFLRNSCTPVRTVTLPSMLVEREVREIGWFDVSPNDPAIQGNEELRDYLNNYLALDNPGTHELDNALKLQYVDDRLRVQRYEAIGYGELLGKVRASGFDLPTEDEWEYLCGGGSRTLWRWGDSYDYGMTVPHFSIDGGEGGWNLSWPNQFGLTIAVDPYRWEVVSGKDVILKGGDGGCNICGGCGLALGFLPVATYYKGYGPPDEALERMEEEIGGDYTSYRRIIRL